MRLRLGRACPIVCRLPESREWKPRETVRLMRMLYVAAVLACLAGCATKQAPAERIVSVPDERIFRIGEQTPPHGFVTVTREVGFRGGGCYLGVMVDGEMAAHIDRAERVTLTLSAGRHVLTATPAQGRGLCGALQTDR